MTQDAELRISEQGAWLEIKLGSEDAPKIMRLKLIPANFEDINGINAKIVEAGKPIKGKEKDGIIDHDRFVREVTEAVEKYVVDWNLHDEKGKITCDPENKKKQLSRFMIAFTLPDPLPERLAGEAVIEEDQPEAEKLPSPIRDKPTVLSRILTFIGNYSNFMEA